MMMEIYESIGKKRAPNSANSRNRDPETILKKGKVFKGRAIFTLEL